MAVRTPQDQDPLTPLEYHEAEGFPEAPAAVHEPDGPGWTAVGIGLVALIAILAALTAAFALASAQGGDTETVAKAAPTAAPAAPAKAPTLADAKGVKFEPFERVDPNAAGGPGRRGQEVPRRRPPARDAGPSGPRADRGVDLRRQRHGIPRHRRQPADRRQRGRQGRDHVRQRRLEGDGGEHAALDRLPLRRGRPEQELRRHRPRQGARRSSSPPTTPACSCTTARRSRSCCTPARG